MTTILVILIMMVGVAILNSEQNLLVPLILTLREEGMIIGGESWELYAGLLGFMPVIVGSLSSIIWGYLGDKFDRRLLFAATILMGAIPTLLTALARNYYELLIARTLSGVGIFGSYPLLNSILADITPRERRGMVYGVAALSIGLGVLGGMLLAGVFARENWRVPFIVTSAPLILIAPLIYVALGNVKLGMAEPEIRRLYETGYSYEYKIKVRELLGELRRTYTIVFLFLQGIPGTVPWGVIVFWSVTFMNVIWGLPESAGTLVVMAAGLGVLTGTLMGGLLSDVLKGRGVFNSRVYISITGIVSGMILTLALISYNYPYGDASWKALLPLMMFAFITFIPVAWAGPNVTSIISETTLPEHRATVYAIFNITNRIGASIAPFLGGFIIVAYKSMGVEETYSYYYALTTATLAWTICALFWLPLIKTYHSDHVKLIRTLEDRARRV
ncbi:MAG: MFS transporter [Thermoprotei archaeon]|nr:MFS transporter [Thermoprotei archaeon]